MLNAEAPCFIPANTKLKTCNATSCTSASTCSDLQDRSTKKKNGNAFTERRKNKYSNNKRRRKKKGKSENITSQANPCNVEDGNQNNAKHQQRKSRRRGRRSKVKEARKATTGDDRNSGGRKDDDTMTMKDHDFPCLTNDQGTVLRDKLESRDLWIEKVKTIVVEDKEIDEGVSSFEESYITSKSGLSMLKASKHNSSIIRAEYSRGDFVPNMKKAIGEEEMKMLLSPALMLNFIPKMLCGPKAHFNARFVDEKKVQTPIPTQIILPPKEACF